MQLRLQSLSELRYLQWCSVTKPVIRATLSAVTHSTEKVILFYQTPVISSLFTSVSLTTLDIT